MIVALLSAVVSVYKDLGNFKQALVLRSSANLQDPSRLSVSGVFRLLLARDEGMEDKMETNVLWGILTHDEKKVVSLI